MATRIGRHIFDVDLKDMSIEQLDTLREGCEHFIKEKRKEELTKKFFALNLEAHAFGFDMCFVNPDDSDDKYILNCYNFEVNERQRD